MKLTYYTFVIVTVIILHINASALKACPAHTLRPTAHKHCIGDGDSDIFKIKTPSLAKHAAKQINGMIKGHEEALWLSADEVEQYLPEETKILFEAIDELSRELGAGVILTGGTARDFAVSVIAEKIVNIPACTDCDVAVLRSPADNPDYIVNERGYERLKQILCQRGYEDIANKIDEMGGVFIDGEYLFEHFVRSKGTAGYTLNLNCLAVAKIDGEYIIFGSSEALTGLQEQVIQLWHDDEASFDYRLVAKMIGRYIIYNDFAGFKLSEDAKQILISGAEEAVKIMGEDDIGKFIQRLFMEVQVLPAQDNPDVTGPEGRLERAIAEFKLDRIFSLFASRIIAIATEASPPSITDTKATSTHFSSQALVSNRKVPEIIATQA